MDGFLIGSRGPLGAFSPPPLLPFSFSIIESFSLLASPLQTALLPLVGKMLTHIPPALTHQGSRSGGEKNFFIWGPGHQSQRRTVTGSEGDRGTVTGQTGVTSLSVPGGGIVVGKCEAQDHLNSKKREFVIPEKGETECQLTTT